MSLTPPKRLFHVPTMSTVMYVDVVDDVKKKGYAVVSHVWGEQKLYEPKELGVVGGVNWEIPLSSRDKMTRLKTAMEFFRKDYCWWDILCMPQDKQEEILKEIPLMGDYYSGALITFVLSDEEYNVPKGLDTWIRIVQKVSEENRSLTREEHEWMHDCKEDLLDISKDQWFNRVWTLQEAALSVDLILMGTNGIYIPLSDIIIPVSRAMDTGDTRIVKPFRNLDKLVIMGFNCAENARYLATIMQATISRDCYKPQDRFYGVLGILGYKDFVVDYDISMEDLNKKIVQYACSKGDLSWLTVIAHDIDGFIPLLHQNFVYASSTWTKESSDVCNVLFEDDTFHINAVEFGRIVDYKYFTDKLQSTQEKILALRDWGFSVENIVYLIFQFKDIPDDVLSMIEACIIGIFKGYTFQKMCDGLGTLFGYGAAKHIYHMRQCVANLVAINNTTIAKVMLNGEGELPIFILGRPDIGDRVILTKMCNLSGRQLGIIVDDHGMRKGTYRIRKTKIRDEFYVRRKFPL